MKEFISDYKDSKGDKMTNMFQKLIIAVDTVSVSTVAYWLVRRSLAKWMRLENEMKNEK